MNPFIRVPLDIVVRSAGLLALDWAWMRLYDAVLLQPGDAGIGEGILGFLLTMSLAGAWAAFDGRNRGFVRLALTWVLVAGVTGVLMTLGIQLHGDVPPDWTVFRSDLSDVMPFLAGLVMVPALALGGLVVGLRRAIPPHQTA